jgi:hypothetical protein
MQRVEKGIAVVIEHQDSSQEIPLTYDICRSVCINFNDDTDDVANAHWLAPSKTHSGKTKGY